MVLTDGKKVILSSTILKSIPITFLRNSIAYDQNFNLVQANTPRFWTINGNMGLMIESSTTNILPAGLSQTFNQAWTSGNLNGTYVISIKGSSGNLTLSGGATGTVTAGNSLVFTVTNSTVTFTPSNNPTYSQLENKKYPTSWTLGGTTRAAETLTVSTNGLNLSEGTVELEFIINDSFKDATAPSHRIFYTGIGSSQDIFSLRNTAGNFGAAISNHSGVAATVTVASSTLANVIHKATMGWKSTVLDLTIDGNSAGTPKTNPSLPSLKSDKIYIGSDASAAQQADTIIKTICLSNKYRTIQERNARANLKAYPLDRNVFAFISLESNIRGVAP
ncbi:MULTISPECIES: hypothetical protein [Methanobacterium]|uniref:Uncharacterized protein n=1 Tax=Methanobacterium bryantii TaxID=2161 RepID=A0A2A2H8J6_METBR|nr:MULTISPECIES: hypothetical protein [Methanobacterium]OEC87882.1 hypothetical protein A9507_06820 [Methanobacterium sp. A39]PAV05749.1 hypothetical protein ASJ80_08430 [Methanobacterium bryantii]